MQFRGRTILGEWHKTFGLTFGFIKLNLRCCTKCCIKLHTFVLSQRGAASGWQAAGFIEMARTGMKTIDTTLYSFEYYLIKIRRHCKSLCARATTATAMPTTPARLTPVLTPAFVVTCAGLDEVLLDPADEVAVPLVLPFVNATNGWNCVRTLALPPQFGAS
jgi:hypothetical protein